MSKDFSQLEKLGFSKAEIDVYINMVSYYYRTLEEVIVATELSENDVKTAINKLKTQGYCKVIPGKQVDQYVALAPSIVITSDAEKKIADDFKQLEDQVRSSWIASRDALQSFVQNYFSEIETIGSNVKSSSEEFKQNSQTKVTDYLDTVNSGSDQDLQKIREDSRKILKNKYEDLKNTTESSLNEVFDVYSNECREMGEKLTEIENNSIELINNLKNDRIKSIDEYYAEIREKIIPAADMIINSLSESKNQAADILSSIEKDVGGLTDELKTMIASQGAEAIEDFAKGSNKLGELALDVENTVNENLGIIRTSLGKFNEDSMALLRTMIEDHVNKSREHLTSFRDKINSRIQEVSTNKINIQKAHVDLMGASGDVNTRIDEELDQLLSKSKDIMGKDYDSVSKTLEDNKGTLEKTIDKEKEQLISELDSLVSSMDSDLETSLETISGKIGETNAGITKDLSEYEKKIKTDLTSSEKGLKSIFNENIHPVIEKGKSSLEETKKKYNSSNETLSRQLVEQLESFSGSGQVLIGTFQESVSQTLNNHNVDIEKAITDQKEQVAVETATLSKDTGDNLDNTKNFLSEVFKNQIENFQSLEKEITASFTSKIDSKTEDVEKSLTDLSEEIDQKNTQILQDIPDDLELFKTDHVAKLEQFEREIRGKLNNILTLTEEMNEALTVKKFKDKERKIFAEKLDEAKLELEPAAAKFSNLIRDQMTSFGDEIDDNLDKFTTTLQKLNDDSKNSLQGNIEDFGKTVDSLKSEINTTVVESMEKTTEFLNKELDTSSAKIDDLNAIITSKVSLISEQMNSVTDVLVKKSKNVTQSALAEIDSHMEALLNAYSSISEQSIAEVNQALTSQSESIVGSLDAVIKNTVDIFGETESEITKSLTDTNERINRDMGETIHSFLSSINNILEINTEDNKKFKENITETISTRTGEIKDAVSENLQSLKSNLVENLMISSKSMADNRDSLENTFTDAFTELKVQSKKNIDEKVSELESTAKIIDNSLAKLVSDTEGGLKIDIEEQDNLIAKLGSETISELDKTAGNLVEYATETNSLSNKTREDLEKMKVSLSDNRQKAIEALTTSFGEVLNRQQNAVSSQNSMITTQISQNFDTLDKEQRKFEKALKETRETLVSKFEEFNREHKETLEDQASQLSEMAKDIASKPNKEIEGKINTTQSTLTGIVNEKMQALNNDVDQIITLLDGESEKISGELSKYSSDLIKEIKDSTDTLSMTVNNKIDGLLSDSREKMLSTESQLAEDIEKTINDIPEKIKQGMSGTAEIMTFIRSIHTFVLDAEPESIDSISYVTGHDRVKEAIWASMLRTVSSTKFLVPKVTDIKEDVLKKIPKTRRVQGLCEINDRAYYDSLASKFANLDIREYSHNTYGFIKDGNEEGGLGVATETKAEMVITSNEDLIASMNQIFVDLWPRGKKL